MKWAADIAVRLIDGTSKTQKFICLYTIIIVVAGIFAYREYNDTEIEKHEIHSHIEIRTDTVYLPTPSKPGEHHWDILELGNTHLPSKSQERIAANG